MNGPQDSDALSPAERRLDEHLELLRTDAPVAPLLGARIMRSVRWQRAVRRPLLTIATLSGAVIDAVRILFAPPKRRP